MPSQGPEGKQSRRAATFPAFGHPAAGNGDCKTGVSHLQVGYPGTSWNLADLDAWSPQNPGMDPATDSGVMQLSTEPRTPFLLAPSACTLLVADTSSEARALLEKILSPIKPKSVTHASDGDELERVFFQQGPHDLVVCRALLGARSGLQILAKARATGTPASFIVYSSLEGPWLRVFVSDAQGTVLSSRVVALEGLPHLALGMLEANRRSSSGLHSIGT
jgi:CheY-like chemotaxis protein